MAGNFIPMVYAVLKDKGVNTKGMTTEQAVEKYNELVGKSGRYNVSSDNSELTVHINPQLFHARIIATGRKSQCVSP